MAATLLETRLLYSSETRPQLPEVHAKRLEGVQMNWTGKSVKRHRGEGCRETHAQIRAEFSIPTVESMIRLRRMVFLSQLRTASPLFRALLQEAGMQLPDQGDCWRRGSPANNAAERYQQCRIQRVTSSRGSNWLWKIKCVGGSS